MQNISLTDGIFLKIEKNDHVGLIKDLSFVISANPDSPGCADLYKFIATSKIQLNDFVGAVEALEKTLTMKPDDNESYELKEALKILIKNPAFKD